MTVLMTIAGMGDTVTAMDCSESQMLNDVVEIISSDIAQVWYSLTELQLALTDISDDSPSQCVSTVTVHCY